jgi:hypothetical protein
MLISRVFRHLLEVREQVLQFRKNISSREGSKCKDPEAETWLVSLRCSKVAHMPGASNEENVGGSEAREGVGTYCTGLGGDYTGLCHLL